MIWSGWRRMGWRVVAAGLMAAGVCLVFNGQIPYGPLWGICCVLGGLAEFV